MIYAAYNHLFESAPMAVRVCQGLELDLPIAGWGDDLTWQGSRWKSIPQPRSEARDPHRLRLNSYPVLLTRGRDGFVVFVPMRRRWTPPMRRCGRRA